MITICIEWYDNVCLDILMTFLAISPSTKQTSGIMVVPIFKKCVFYTLVYTQVHTCWRSLYITKSINVSEAFEKVD